MNRTTHTTRRPYRPVAGREVRFEESIFDEGIIADLAGQSGTDQHEVLRSLGVKPPIDEHLSPELQGQGASVLISDRLVALQGIMEAYNQINKYLGGNQSFDYNAVRDEYQLEGMGKKASAMEADLAVHFKTLNASDAMKRLGFSDKEIEVENTYTESALVNQYGPGRKVFAPARAAFLKTIQTPGYTVDRDKPKPVRRRK